MGAGKDRIFTFATIEKLKTNYMELLELASECSQAIKKIRDELRGLVDSVPIEARYEPLGDYISEAQIEIEKFNRLYYNLKMDIDKLLKAIP